MSNRRKILKQIGFASLLATVSPSALIRNALANGNKPITPGINKITGNVTINGKPAQTGMAVVEGDIIVTGPGSEAIYVIGQDAYLQRASSTVSFAASVMRVVTGKILSVFGKGEKKLETPTATIGIRGTGCYIEAEEKRIYFCLCYGVADVVPAADPSHSERIETKHHDHPIYIYKDSSMPMMVDAGLINHNDAELELLENLVGRWPAFYQSKARY
jgi:hypothetical protein